MQGENVLVTGASRGIGRAVALALAENGAYVTGTATTPEGAQQIGALLSEAGFQQVTIKNVKQDMLNNYYICTKG